MAHTTIIGIDVSKNFADACAISAQGEVMLETKIFYDTVGLQHFLKQLDQLAGEQRLGAVCRNGVNSTHITESWKRTYAAQVLMLWSLIRSSLGA